ncbi:hypothetical protein H7097_00085 [Aeromicrobium sp.]|nr:hypothetical protein [Candidatus Saccharibacteria bacterium]
MQVYLISGLSGTGKTTLGNALSGLGHEVIDMDSQFGYDGNVQTEDPIDMPAPPTKDWFVDNGWIWSSHALEPILKAPRDKPLFLCGGSRNESKFYSLVDTIFVLHVPDHVMRTRLMARNDPHTSSELIITRMIEFNQQTYKRALVNGGHIIETTEPIDVCVTNILERIGS